VTLTFEQFRYGFANALSKDEARQVYDDYHVERSTVPITPVALVNGHPHSNADADNKSRVRGPMLIISGGLDHQVPPAVVHAAYRRQGMNPGLTQFLEIKDAAIH
jgi:non-heme chloroperoxidase